jgi:UDP-N-acetylmuramoylalanine--D-glutamate ligase
MNYCVIGAAKSGIAAVRLAHYLNTDFDSQSSAFITDDGVSSVNNSENISSKNFINNRIVLLELSSQDNFSNEIELFNSLEVDYRFGAESQSVSVANELLPETDMLILSPGVPNDIPFLIIAKEYNVEIVSELEFAFRYLTNKIIAITGTNGKTTTTALIEHIFNSSKISAMAGGNIGLPLSDIAHQILSNPSEKVNKDTIIVLEVSSYQLEFCSTFRPDIAIILNVTPDHLAYHKSFENYLATKLKISINQTAEDFLIINSDDEALDCKDISQFSQRTQIKSKIFQFSLSSVSRGITVFDDKLFFLADKFKEEIMQKKDIKLPGIHNRYNSMAAAIAAKLHQITNEDIRQAFATFEGVEHRLELVDRISAVDYINDSKATNVNATWYALSSYDRPII